MSRSGFFIAVVGGSIAGLIVAFAPGGTAALAALGLVGICLGLAVPLSGVVALTLGVALAVPFDYMRLFDVDARGVPLVVFALAALGPPLIARIVQQRGRGLGERIAVPRATWPVLAVAGATLVTTLVNRDLAGLRPFMLWMTGLVSVVAVVTATREDPTMPRKLLWTIALVSSIVSLAVLVDRAVGVTTWAVVPTFEPVERTFADVWARAAGLAGHPLRLGTLTMLGVLSGVSLGAYLRKALPFALAAASLLALVLSAARGAWIGLAVGLLVLLVLVPSTARMRAGAAVAAMAGTAVAGAALLGLGGFVAGRLAGSAADQASVEQRLAVLDVGPSLLRARPLFGYGYGGYIDAVTEAGLGVANLENEYLGFALKGGAVLGLALASLLAYMVVVSVLRRGVGTSFAFGAMLAAIAFNMATYNLLDWSSMPFVVCVLLGGLVADGIAADSGDKDLR